MTSMFDFTHAGYWCVVIQPCPSGHPSWIVKIDHFCLIFHKITIKKEERAPSRGWPGHIHIPHFGGRALFVTLAVCYYCFYYLSKQIWYGRVFSSRAGLSCAAQGFWEARKKKRLQLRSLHLRCVSRNVRRRRRPRCWPGTVHY